MRSKFPARRVSREIPRKIVLRHQAVMIKSVVKSPSALERNI